MQRNLRESHNELEVNSGLRFGLGVHAYRGSQFSEFLGDFIESASLDTENPEA